MTPTTAKRGRHPERALSALKIRSITRPGRYADGNGLYLIVDPSGAKRWVLRTVVRGKRSDIGLGGVSVVPLAEAREKATSYRKLARAGGDPLAEKRLAKAVIPTFEEASRKVHAEHAGSWKNSKHRAQWINTLSEYAFPHMGKVPVDKIGTPDVLRALGPIWLTKPETARRVKQRIATVLDWTTASGFRTGENPVDGVSKGLPKQPDRKSHFGALAFEDVAEFVQSLRMTETSEIVRIALEFLILTATRTGEVLGARWSEIDADRAVWTIPGDRMKAGRGHRVPLAPRCVAILARARELSSGSDYCFPGRDGKRPLSNMAFLMLLRRMDRAVTIHGFRSTFRDWTSERTNFPREVAEQALAHVILDRTEAAYRRGDLFEKRRTLMETWAAFVCNERGEVIALRAG